MKNITDNFEDKMYVLGISCYYHDASAALLKDGIIVAAVAEERFTRKITKVLKEGYDRNRLVERAKSFTWEEIAKKEIGIYQSAIQRRDGLLR